MAALRWGILGTGRITERIVAAGAASRAATVVAVGSRSRERAERHARRHGIPRAHGSYEALLADPDVDAVYVALPNSLHLPWTRRALAAGRHVLCEKPLGTDPAAVTAAFDEAAAAGLVLTEAFMYRHHPQTARMAGLVRDGAVGRPALIRSSFGFLLEDLGDVRLRADLEGGALMDVGCYCVSASRLLAGAEPVRVYATARRGGDGVDVRLAGQLEFASGLVAQFDCFFDLPARGGIEVIGTEGTLVAHDPWLLRAGRLELRRHGAAEDVPAPAADSYRLELENVAAAAEGRVEPLLGREDAVGQARTLEALHRSAAEGRSIDVG